MPCLFSLAYAVAKSHLGSRSRHDSFALQRDEHPLLAPAGRGLHCAAALPLACLGSPAFQLHIYANTTISGRYLQALARLHRRVKYNSARLNLR